MAQPLIGFNNKCLDAQGSSTDNGTPIILWQQNGGDNQKWTLTSDGYIESSMDGNKCLDIQGDNPNNGTPIILWEKNGGDNQKWRLTQEGYLESVLDSSKCMDVQGGNPDNGTPIILWEKNGGNNQKWYVNPSNILSLEAGEDTISVSPIANIKMQSFINLDKNTRRIEINTHTWTNNTIEGGIGSVSVHLMNGQRIVWEQYIGRYGVDAALSPFAPSSRNDSWAHDFHTTFPLSEVDRIVFLHQAARDWSWGDLVKPALYIAAVAAAIYALVTGGPIEWCYTDADGRTICVKSSDTNRR